MGQGQSIPVAGAAASSRGKDKEQDLAVQPAAAAAAWGGAATAGSSDTGASSSGSSGSSSSSNSNDCCQIDDVDLTAWLSEDCLALVFAKLGTVDRNSCSLVCRRWLRVESQSRQLLLLLARADLLSFLPSLLGRFKHLTKLALKCDRKFLSIDDGGLFLIGKYAQQLERLKLKGCRQVTDIGLESFAMVSSRLKKLSCGSCGFGSRGLNAVLDRCSMLEDLSVKKLKNIAQESEERVGPGRCRLRRLCLKDLPNGHVFTALVAGSRHLQTLILARVSGNWNDILAASVGQLSLLTELRMEKIQLSDKGLFAVSRCRSLQTLYVVKCPEYSNLGVSSVAAGCRGLRKLHLDGCFAGLIGDEGLRSVGLNCNDLQELVLIRLNVRAESLAVLAAHCCMLERLAVCNSESFGDIEMQSVVVSGRALKKLCIKSCPISDAGLAYLASACPNLVKLKVKKCRAVSAGGAASLQAWRPDVVVAVDSADSPVLLHLHPQQPQQQQHVQQQHAQQQQQQQHQDGLQQALSRASFVKTRLAWLAAGFRR